MHTSGFLGQEGITIIDRNDLKKQSTALEILYRRNSLKNNLRKRLRLQRSPKVKDFILGLERSADSLRKKYSCRKAVYLVAFLSFFGVSFAKALQIMYTLALKGYLQF